MCATWCYLYALAEAFQVLVTEFSPNWTRNFRFIHCSVFIVHSSVLIAEGPEKEEV